MGELPEGLFALPGCVSQMRDDCQRCFHWWRGIKKRQSRVHGILCGRGTPTAGSQVWLALRKLAPLARATGISTAELMEMDGELVQEMLACEEQLQELIEIERMNRDGR